MIGIYGGTFDPIHFGHLNLSLEMCERYHLEEVWFCPTGANPLKDKPITPFFHRLEMLKLALLELPHFKIIETESTEVNPSYTIDTLKKILSEHPKKQFCLILGEDAIKNFAYWKDPEAIVALVPLFIGARSCDVPHIEASVSVQKAIQEGLKKTQVFDISSTAIRERLSKKLYCGHLIPSKVIDYIYKHELYSI